MKILHILRAPIGGLFRHVKDLAQQQINQGHEVGFITAEPGTSEYAKKLFDSIEPQHSKIKHHKVAQFFRFQTYQTN